MENSISLITALISFITALVPLLVKERKDYNHDYYEAKKSIIQTNHQNYSNISTIGGHSSININSVQQNISNALTKNQENKIRQDNFAKNYLVMNNWLRFFCILVLIFIFLMLKFVFHSTTLLKSLIYYSSIVFSSFSISIFAVYVVRFIKRKYLFSQKGSLEDFMTVIFRKVQQFFYPLIIVLIQLILLYYFLNENLLFGSNVFRLYLGFFVSIYSFVKISQYILLNNMKTIGMALKNFGAILFVLFFTIIIYLL